MTNHWSDIKNADVILIMGGNAAEAHPCGFKWVTEAKARNKARLVVVDPRFTRSAALADLYAPIRTGTDIAFLGGVINYLIAGNKVHLDYIKSYTDMSYLVKDEFAFADGFFSGYDAEKRRYDKTGWEYQTGEDGYVKTDPTLENPRCVWNLLKAHFARYTPEMVEKICGTPKDKFLQVAELLASTHTPDRVMTILYALGWTQHSTGSQIIRTAAMVQLLLGNIGRAGGGVNALRGHSNIQGLTDLGLLSNLLPGYMTLPGEKETDYDAYIAKRAPKPMRPGQLSYWQNYGKFHVSLMKAWFGNAATRDNNWAFDWLPKLDKTYDVLQVFELMHQGKMNGYFAQGFNPLNSFPNKAKVSAALAKLKFLVIMDPLATETSEFWQNHGEFNDVDPAKIQTTVFRLPTTCFAEEDGAWEWVKVREPAPPDDFALASYREFRVAAGDTMKSMLSSCNVRLKPLSIRAVRDLTSKDELDLAHMGDEGAKVALFASMSDTDSTFDFLFALLMDTAVSALCAEALEAHGGSLPTTVHFVFDEFANIGRIPDFERTIAVTRSRNIAVSMIAQSLSQLKETYGDNNAETIVNACDTLLYLGGKANETNEEISKMAGKQTVASETQSDSRGAGWTRTVNRGISERDLIQPAEVARMPREDALVLVNGCMPLMDRKYRLERHPRSRLLEEAAHRGPFDFAEYRRQKEGNS